MSSEFLPTSVVLVWVSQGRHYIHLFRLSHTDIHFFTPSQSSLLFYHFIFSILFSISVTPLRGSSIDIHPNAKWQQNGLTVAGGNGQGNGINQLSNPWGLYVDDDQTIYVADESNHRIVEWKWGATSGQVVAGGNGQGSGNHQLSNPTDVIVDKERDSLIICDCSNRRVVRWPRRNGTNGETIISNIDCCGFDNGREWISLCH